MTTPVQIILQFRQQASGESPDYESYHVEAIQAPGYGWGGPFQIRGLDDGQAQAIWKLYRDYLNRRQTASLPVSQTQIEPLRMAGNQLFQAFPESLQQRLHHAQAVSQAQGRNLELVLSFEPSAYALLNLPWELLHDPASRNFFALRGGGIIRRLVLPTATQLPANYRPKQILGVWAEPLNLETLHVRRKFAPAPGRGEYISIWLEGNDTLPQMQNALAQGGFDGLHLVAHGQGGINWHDFTLAFVGSKGYSHFLNIDQFSTFLAHYPEIKFIYLDVCASGKAEKEYAPGGPATDLLSLGIPLMIVMQDDMSQEAAGLVAQETYRSLQNGATITEAVTNGRRAVRLGQDDPVHWSVPVLYGQQYPRSETPVSQHPFDWWLDREKQVFKPALFIWLSITLLVVHLSYAFSLVPLTDILTLRPLVLIGQLLPILGAATIRAGYQQLAERYHLNWREWLVVWQHKYLAALLRSFGAWTVLWVIWLALYWAGWLNQLETRERQFIWLLGLIGLTLAGCLGAHQGMRQNLLFWRTAPRHRESFLFSLGFFIPLIYLGLPLSVWDLADIGMMGIFVMIGFAIVMTAILESGNQ